VLVLLPSPKARQEVLGNPEAAPRAWFVLVAAQVAHLQAGRQASKIRGSIKTAAWRSALAVLSFVCSTADLMIACWLQR
jgi:hypothetical protein